MMIQGFLQSGLNMASGEFIEENNTFSQTYTPKLRQGEEKPVYLTYTMSTKPVEGYRNGIVDKVLITGDWEYTVKFFTRFWSRSVSLDDVKEGEFATTRFLTDVATISYLGDNQGKIEVVSAKDR